MSIVLKVKVLQCEEIHELPDSWTTEDFKNILDLTDFEGWEEIDDNELKEYAIMALQDMDADEAASIVLKYVLGDRLTTGQIHNLSYEMLDEKLWEEYTDITMHADLFKSAVLLKWAFPNKFPETDAIKCVLEIECDKPETYNRITKTFLTRLLASGMEDRALLNRLFSDQLSKDPFPEAEGIIWSYSSTNEGSKAQIILYSSEYWLHTMKEVSSYNFQTISK